MSIAAGAAGLTTGIVFLPFAVPAYRACTRKRLTRMVVFLSAGTAIALPAGYLVGLALI
jgi:hypothetical protein